MVTFNNIIAIAKNVSSCSGEETMDMFIYTSQCCGHWKN